MAAQRVDLKLAGQFRGDELIAKVAEAGRDAVHGPTGTHGGFDDCSRCLNLLPDAIGDAQGCMAPGDPCHRLVGQASPVEDDFVQR